MNFSVRVLVNSVGKTSSVYMSVLVGNEYITCVSANGPMCGCNYDTIPHLAI